MTLEITFAVLTAITIGLTEVVKRLLPASLKSRLTPVIALIFAVALSVGSAGFNFTSILIGLVIGLSSVGLYGGTKSVVGN